jgi:uncharacterized protein (DUF433 family)
LCHTAGVKAAKPRALGQYIVADSGICSGKPIFKGTRVTVADVLADVEQGLSWDFICYRWGDGRINKEAIAEAVQLARRALLAPDGRLAHNLDAVA